MRVLRERADGRVWVKLCGFRDPALAAVAVAEGADAVGVVLHEPSPRNCSLAQAAEVVAAADPVPVVAVVADRSRAELQRIVPATGVAAVQLCGSEPAADTAWLRDEFAGLCVIRVRHLDPSAGAVGRIDPGGADAVLVDAEVAGSAGGTGVELALGEPVDAEVPVILAGGLDTASVARAIAAVRPFGVDVSSALEVVRGTKDAGRIRSFMDAVRAAVVAP